MNTAKNMILKNGDDITTDVEFCKYNRQTQKWDVTFNGGKTYPCNYNMIEWLKEPEVIDTALVRIKNGDHELFNIEAVYIFSAHAGRHWLIRFTNGSERSYREENLEITTSCLNNADANNCLEYLRQIAEIVSLRAKDDGTKLLVKQYENMDFVGSNTALAVYLNPQDNRLSTLHSLNPIFPFGSNSSQFKAVQTALNNQISVIEGPPGTGKTQTILNIIANLLLQGKTVEVVSNNNAATTNVLEKLSSPHYGMGFLVAPLGCSDNKIAFIDSQDGHYPDISGWEISKEEYNSLAAQVRAKSCALDEIFKKQERLAKARQRLSALELEIKYFEQYCTETDYPVTSMKTKKPLSTFALMQLWQQCQDFSDRERSLTLWFKLKSFLFYGISDWKFYKNDLSKIITLMQGLYYGANQKEIEDEISTIEVYLSAINAAEMIEDFTGHSMKLLRAKLFDKYGNKTERQIFAEDDLWKNSNQVVLEYPIVLSTTFSSRSSLGKSVVYDYLIMDEASQVDVTTGALALSCAKNVVIVGDTKQLPNVVKDDIRKRTDAVFHSFTLAPGYDYAQNSFLQSVCNIVPNVPGTMLREHYRCHPKIIEFCNQKFYRGELVVMTKDCGESDVLTAYRTVVGNHARQHINQRQIDVICSEIMPTLKKHSADDVGIIAPYNDQVNALQQEFSCDALDIATVHKFQGREKDTIVMTTVNDVISEFADDPNLLNVAVSRAKKRFCIVVSGNEQPADSNIGDLISYIEYNNFDIVQSEIYSIFDFLYKQYTEQRLAYLKKHKRVSEFDSENLMYGLLQTVLEEDCYASLDVICHQPLNMLIRNPKLLNDTECRYAMNSATHLDFLIYNRISKKTVLAVEVDGFAHHKDGTIQAERDRMKNHILKLYGIPLLRFPTNGSGEHEKIKTKLESIINK